MALAVSIRFGFVVVKFLLISHPITLPRTFSHHCTATNGGCRRSGELGMSDMYSALHVSPKKKRRSVEADGDLVLTPKKLRTA